MTLEEVKEHFKYAKEVRCLSDGKVYDLNEKSEKGIYSNAGCFWFDINYQTCLIYDKDKNKLAPILTYIFERGEEVEVSDTGNEYSSKWFFIGFNKIGYAVSESKLGCVSTFRYIRKLQPETLLEPELSELKKKAESNGMTVTIVFDNLKK